MNTGTNEKRELLSFLTALGVLIGKELSGDGIQITDVLKIFDKEEFRAKVSHPLEGVNSVPAELQEFSVSQGFDLELATLESFREILEAFAGEVAQMRFGNTQRVFDQFLEVLVRRLRNNENKMLPFKAPPMPRRLHKL